MLDRRLPGDERGAALRSEDAVGTWRDPTHVAPVNCYLLIDAGASINGQLLGAIGGRLVYYRLVEPREVIRAEEQSGFSIEEMFRCFPNEIGAELEYDSAPWPPPIGNYE